MIKDSERLPAEEQRLYILLENSCTNYETKYGWKSGTVIKRISKWLSSNGAGRHLKQAYFVLAYSNSTYGRIVWNDHVEELTAVTDMTNEEVFEEMQKVGKMMSDFEAANNMEARNALVPRYRELRRAYDWGFEIGQSLESNAWQKRWQEVKIVAHDDVDNLYLIKNDKGWEVWVDGMSLRQQEKAVHAKILPPDKANDYEQLVLEI